NHSWTHKYTIYHVVLHESVIVPHYLECQTFVVSCTPFGVLPSPMVLVCEEIFQTIQCVNNPLGASGSSTINARLFAPEGTSAICKGGLVSAPSQVNFDGMFAPS